MSEVKVRGGKPLLVHLNYTPPLQAFLTRVLIFSVSAIISSTFLGICHGFILNSVHDLFISFDYKKYAKDSALPLDASPS